jgi:hypothetical protein
MPVLCVSCDQKKKKSAYFEKERNKNFCSNQVMSVNLYIKQKKERLAAF